jgi:hypothetical protein
VPRQITTGGKPRLAGITKRGNCYLRKLLIHGARAVLPTLSKSETPLGGWLRALLARVHKNAAVVALASTRNCSPARSSVLSDYLMAGFSQNIVDRPSLLPSTLVIETTRAQSANVRWSKSCRRKNLPKSSPISLCHRGHDHFAAPVDRSSGPYGQNLSNHGADSRRASDP